MLHKDLCTFVNYDTNRNCFLPRLSLLQHLPNKLTSKGFRNSNVGQQTNNFTVSMQQWKTELHLDKRVNGHDSHVWLALGIVHQVEVDQLFQFQVVRLHAIHNIWEKSTAGEQVVTWVLKTGNYINPPLTFLTLFLKDHLTSFPTVIDAMTFLTASFFFSFLSLFSSALSSNISPAHTQEKERK